jgi:hypothetical protein
MLLRGLKMNTCDECEKAQTRAFHPLYWAHCKGCAVRSLAGGPLFHAGGLDGGNAAPYRKLLAQMFGDEWRLGHEQVVAERERQKALETAAKHADSARSKAPTGRQNDAAMG